ncbi:MAG: flagellar motor switch protein FliN [Planctomycetes bacterium]|nr:flagellar motor switch protein FliN [Planctomycetota bacterium]
MTDESQESELEQAIEDATQAVAVQANELPELSDGTPSGAPLGLSGVMNVPVRVTVRVGSTQLKLSELVSMAPGSIIPLDRDAHEPADIVINGRLLARGEVVTIQEKYAVRITEVL